MPFCGVYGVYALLDPDFDIDGFDDVLESARCGRVAPDELYGGYTDACRRYADRKAAALRERERIERIERELREAMERRTVEAERNRQAYLEWRQRRAKELEERTLRDWEKVIAAHNAWLASW